MATAVADTDVSFRVMLKENAFSWAEQMVAKWDPNNTISPYANVASIFIESRDEARRFLLAVQELRKNVEQRSNNHTRHLMEAAMKRLRKEFAEILQHNRDASPVSPEPTVDASSTAASQRTSFDSEDEDTFPAAAMDYLRSVAECMIGAGHARECLELYKNSRRSVVEDGLSRLGVEHVSSSHVQKVSWESLEFKIEQWVNASSSVFGEIFTGERILCDSIFSSCDQSIADSCFAEITRDAAVQFFKFPSVMASKHRRTPEKILQYLSMYRAIRILSPEIAEAFSSKATNMVLSQVEASLLTLASTIKSMLSDFESGIHRDTPRATPAGGGLHALTQQVMDYLVLLSDYADAIADVYADDPLPPPIDSPPRPSFGGKVEKLERIVEEEEHPEEEEEEEARESMQSSGPAATSRFAWLITILFCKLDVKAELYKEASQSYLFLANNHQYVVNRVKESDGLADLLGPEWMSIHEGKARSFARSFLKLSWKKVLDAVPDDTAELPAVEARQRMAQFNKAFEEVCKSQIGWVVLDPKVRDEIKWAVTKNLVGRYRPFYEKCRTELREKEGPPAAVRFAPEDVVNHLSGLYKERSGSFHSSHIHRSRSFGSLSSLAGGGSSRGNRWKWFRET